ncbi:hypothetical protein [Rubidibacter lacunae]|uniref:hypothetical protein n=1 Tax=Rubidibacter lacunae TaxID=582514 RepID=UPI0012EB310D|nr:hypothetical protein [Rubidibacter lacunae]
MPKTTPAISLPTSSRSSSRCSLLPNPAVAPAAPHFTGSDLNFDDLIDAANQPTGKGGLTKAGRALDKLANKQRGNSPFPALSGNNQNKNNVAEQQLTEILNSPDAVFKKLGKGGIEVRLPDRRGVRFNSDGAFGGFVD